MVFDLQISSIWEAQIEGCPLNRIFQICLGGEDIPSDVNHQQLLDDKGGRRAPLFTSVYFLNRSILPCHQAVNRYFQIDL